MFGPYTDYLIPLLKILNVLPEKMGRGEDVLVLFETQYSQEIPDNAYRRSATSRKRFWVQCVYNIQQKAKQLGLVDNPSRGYWRLTEEGHKWLLDHPNATNFTEKRTHPKNSGVARSPRVKKVRQSASQKEKLTAYQSKSKILVREITNIQAYLDGHSSMQPSAEKLCDWVAFCYTFEMYTEGRDLFALISPNDVHPWFFERTKKLARLCQLRGL